MGWSQTEPALPSGSEWEQTITKTNFFAQNWYKLSAEYSIARLDGRQFAVRVTVSTAAGSYGFDPSVANLYLRCDIGGAEGEAEDGGAIQKTEQSWYFIGEAGVDAEITVVCGATNSSASRTSGTVTLYAPPQLSSTVFVRVDGEWKKAGAVFVSVDGEWKKGPVKLRTGGEWK